MESKSASVSVEGLKVFLEDAWWAAALRKIWATCSDEAVAAPQIEKILSILATRKNTGEAWCIAQSRLARWNDTLRGGAVSQIVTALKSHAEEEVTRMVRDSNSIAVDVWMVQARNLRGQCERLRAFADL